jgi:hypothetical protein
MLGSKLTGINYFVERSAVPWNGRINCCWLLNKTKGSIAELNILIWAAQEPQSIGSRNASSAAVGGWGAGESQLRGRH